MFRFLFCDSLRFFGRGKEKQWRKEKIGERGRCLFFFFVPQELFYYSSIVLVAVFIMFLGLFKNLFICKAVLQIKRSVLSVMAGGAETPFFYFVSFSRYFVFSCLQFFYRFFFQLFPLRFRFFIIIFVLQSFS